MHYLREEVRVMPLKCKEAKAAYDKAYRKDNKEKISTRQKAYYVANKEKIKAKHKAYHSANKEKRKAYRKANKERIKANKAAWYVANREKIKAYAVSWREANRDRRSAAEAKRKALKLEQIPIYLRDCPIEEKRIYQTYKLRDAFIKITGVQHHVDHMWPLSDGGPHWSGNLQIITATENVRKHAKVDPTIKATIQEMLIEEEKMRYEEH